MIGTISIECNAKNPNMPLWPLRSYVNSPSSLRVSNVPKKIGKWQITKVTFTAVYPDGSIKSADCALVGGVWVGTIEGTATSGTSENGYTIFADGIDENGNAVTGYVLGKGNIEILEADGTLSPDPTRYYVKLLSAEATQPREGDMYPTSSGYVIWQNGQANQLGTPFDQITAYVDSAISSKQDLLSEDQLSAISQAQLDLTTAIQYQDGTYDAFILSSNTLSKNTLKELGALADDGVTWLKEPMYVSTGSNVTWIDTGTFMNATHLLSFIGKNVVRLQSNVFNGCTVLRRVNIPNVEQLATQVFYNCTSLTSLTLPKSLVIANRNAFYGNSFDYVLFEGKTLEEVKAMANFSKWGLTEDQIRTYVYRDYVDTQVFALQDEISAYVDSQVSTLSSDPYVGGWRIVLQTPHSGSGTYIEFVGRVMSDDLHRNTLFSGSVCETDIPELSDYLDMQFNLWIVKPVSDIVDGATLTNAIGGHLLEFADLYYFANGDYPQGNMRTTFTTAHVYRR